MPTLREVVAKASKKRRNFGSPKPTGGREKRPGYFEVDIHFDVVVPYVLREVVTADTKENAMIKAVTQFGKRGKNNNITTGKQREYDSSRWGMINVHPFKVTQKSKPQLSQQQMWVLRELARGFKLFPYRSYYLLAVRKEDIEGSSDSVGKQTVSALWRRGFIAPPSEIIKGDEKRTQIALGTFPKGKVMVLNRKVIEEFRINLKPKKGGE